jgi:Protein of unknown function (DUF3037)
VSEKRKLEYFLLRYVPNAVREEFVNIGLVMTENGGDGGGFAGMHFTRDWRHARCLDVNVDVDVLEALGREIERRLGDVQQRAMLLHEMMDSYSGAVQVSPMRYCLAENPAQELKDLASRLVEIPAALSVEEVRAPRTSGRKWIHGRMANAFQAAGIWDFLNKDVPATPYTNERDKFTFDFGYAFGGEVKLFHAVSLADVGPETRMFPLRVAKIGPKMAMLRKATPVFTAVVEDAFDEVDEQVLSVLAFMKDEQIRVARLREMPEIAEVARVELRA